MVTPVPKVGEVWFNKISNRQIVIAGYNHVWIWYSYFNSKSPFNIHIPAEYFTDYFYFKPAPRYSLRSRDVY